MTMANCPQAMKRDVEGYIAIILAPTLDPKVRYPRTATTSYIMQAPPIDDPMTIFMRSCVLLLSSL